MIHACHKCGKGFSYPSKLKAHFSRKTSCTTGNALSSNENSPEVLSSAGNALRSNRNFSEVLSSAGNLSELPNTKLRDAGKGWGMGRCGLSPSPVLFKFGPLILEKDRQWYGCSSK